MLTGVFMKKKEKHDPKLVALAGELAKHMKTESDISSLSQVFRKLCYYNKSLRGMDASNQSSRRSGELRSKRVSPGGFMNNAC